MRSGFAKYLAFGRIAFQQELAARGAVLSRFAFYAILLLVFAYLWKAVNAHAELSADQSVNMIWYLALTEWIVLSVPMSFAEVEKDIKSGDIAYLLCRPVSYLDMKLCEALGMLALRMLVLGGAGFLFAWFFAGRLPPNPSGLLLAAPLCVAAGVLATLSYTAIGYAAFWLEEATPVYWVWQKSSFILGGLILPLSIYPAWLQKLALASPFSYLLYRPAHAVMSADPLEALTTLLGQLAWGLIAFGVLKLLHLRGQQILQVNGG